jgi:hypothetical protein
LTNNGVRGDRGSQLRPKTVSMRGYCGPFIASQSLRAFLKT